MVNTAIAEEAGLTDIASGWDNWDDFIVDAKEMTGMQDDVMTRADYLILAKLGLLNKLLALIIPASIDAFPSDHGRLSAGDSAGPLCLYLGPALDRARHHLDRCEVGAGISAVG